MAKFISFLNLHPFLRKELPISGSLGFYILKPFTLSMSMIIGYDFKSPSDFLHVLPLSYTLDQSNKTVPNMTDISTPVLHTLLDT